MSELAPAPHGYPIKLVRDKTTDVIGDKGVLFYDNIPLGLERQEWLYKKLGEEVTEFLVKPGLDELADILSVIEALARYFDHTIDELAELAVTDPRGGFLEGRMMRGYHADFDGR
jgi:predicted house-cleaning noncanonical NTP pyrophosphatase (MazG superfamily)